MIIPRPRTPLRVIIKKMMTEVASLDLLRCPFDAKLVIEVRPNEIFKPQNGKLLFLVKTTPSWILLPEGNLHFNNRIARISSQGFPGPRRGLTYLGWETEPLYQNLGIMTKFLTLFLQQNPGRFGACIRPNNLASRRVAEKCGFRPYLETSEIIYYRHHR